MEVHLVTASGAEKRSVDELESLLAQEDGVVWVDTAAEDPECARVLTDVLHCHPLAVRDCVERNRVARVRAYPDHVLVILHTPQLGKSGHVHYVELDQLIGERYLVTVHGPVNPAVPPDMPVRETKTVLRRITEGRLNVGTPFELSHAVVSGMAHHQESVIEELTREVWQLEQRVTGGHMGDPEEFLEELFQARHGLLSVRTMSALSIEAYGRMAFVGGIVPPGERRLVDDLVDQFDRVRRLADGEKDYLQGVIEFYRARAETKMTIAAERLAVIAVITLPITALSSIYGMNIIVNQGTHVGQLAAVLTVMVAMSTLLLTWAKRQGWW
jgi:magnesium transporter